MCLSVKTVKFVNNNAPGPGNEEKSSELLIKLRTVGKAEKRAEKTVINFPEKHTGGEPAFKPVC